MRISAADFVRVKTDTVLLFARRQRNQQIHRKRTEDPVRYTYALRQDIQTWRKNMQTKIKKWGINGEGIAYVNKKAVFVENAIPGEVVDIEIDQDCDTYARAHATDILEPAPRRRQAPCANWQDCGGCGLMHVDYKGQVRMKEQVLKEALRKYAGYDGEILPLIKNPNPLAYRNACKLPFGDADGKTVTGMYRRATNEFVPMERCLIHSKKLEFARMAIHDLVNKYNLHTASQEDPAGLRMLVLKEFDDQVHAVFITGEMELPEAFVQEALENIPEVASVWQSVKTADDSEIEVFGREVEHLGGQEQMTLTLGDFNLSLLPKSFFQLNTAQAKNLYEWIAARIPSSTGLMVEAYSGVGAISLYAADKADQVIGIESIADAVDNANANARLNSKDNLSFICGDAAAELKTIADDRHVDTLVVDPPRSGLDDAMKEAILEAKPQTLLYISCNPATLGKDLKVLQKEYRITCVQPFDIFSQTPHVETVALLSRKSASKSFIPVSISPKDMGLSEEKDQPTYANIHDYVQKMHGMKVSSLYVAQMKAECGLETQADRSGDKKQPKCPPEKREAILDAFRHFGLIGEDETEK